MYTMQLCSKTMQDAYIGRIVDVLYKLVFGQIRKCNTFAEAKAIQKCIT